LALRKSFSVNNLIFQTVEEGLGSRGYGRFQRLRPAILKPELISGLLFVGIAALPLDADDLAADPLKQQTGHLGK
jgi:hypothetical protein